MLTRTSLTPNEVSFCPVVKRVEAIRYGCPVTENRTVSASLAVDVALADQIADVAAVTFPLACPPHSPAPAIAEFIATHLSASKFREYIDSADADVLIASGGDGAIIGYSLVLHRDPADPDVAAVVTARPASEVSKIYVLPDHHGSGTSHALMAEAIAVSRARGSAVVWLGVNQENVRAQRFYAKIGFVEVGTKTFDLGGVIEQDFVLGLGLG